MNMLATIQNLDRQTIEDFLYAEARCLDEKDWDGWLSHYSKDAVFWMPAWDDDDKIVEDPQREISLIYYGSKQGLEDRVFRIRTDRSSATSAQEIIAAGGQADAVLADLETYAGNLQAMEHAK